MPKTWPKFLKNLHIKGYAWIHNKRRKCTRPFLGLKRWNLIIFRTVPVYDGNSFMKRTETGCNRTRKSSRSAPCDRKIWAAIKNRKNCYFTKLYERIIIIVGTFFYCGYFRKDEYFKIFTCMYFKIQVRTDPNEASTYLSRPI